MKSDFINQTFPILQRHSFAGVDRAIENVSLFAPLATHSTSKIACVCDGEGYELWEIHVYALLHISKEYWLTMKDFERKMNNSVIQVAVRFVFRFTARRRTPRWNNETSCEYRFASSTKSAPAHIFISISSAIDFNERTSPPTKYTISPNLNDSISGVLSL